ncbi:MAG: hypothetical protein MGG11_20655 [Trichodesmium sp. MAG_R03]|nr:hypothetical protein [Trichodesmium sp. MAG_R03]
MNFQKLIQFKGKVRHLFSLTLSLVSLLATGEAKSASFNFTKIADTTNQTFQSNTRYSKVYRGLGTAGGLSWEQLGSDGLGIAIGDGGYVVYHAQKSSGLEGIYYGLGSAPITVATNGTIFESFGKGIAINARQETAFIATTTTGETNIYVNKPTWSGGPRLIASSNDGYNFARGVSINNNGDVAFTAEKSGYVNVYKASLPPNGSTPSNITNITRCDASSANGDVCPFVDFEAPSINNNGFVSFSSKNGIFIGDGGSISPIISNNPNFLVGSYREPNINDKGFVSGFVRMDPGETPIVGIQGQIIFSGNGTSGNVIAGNYIGSNEHGSFRNMGTSSINNGLNTVDSNGDVVFMAKGGFNDPSNRISMYDIGIFVGQDPIENKVISVGDRIEISPGVFTSPIQDLAMDRGSLSNDGEISFWARLDDDTEGVYRANPLGASQFNPWLPNCPIQNPGTMSFCGITSGEWYDPPTADGFHYEMDSDSLFTSILDFPSTFENPFTVAVEDIVLGEFSSGDEVNFSLYDDILGDFLIGGQGVERFTVLTGDAIDPTDPMALPLKIAFNTDIADFTLHPVNRSSIPEPTMIFGLLSVSALFVGFRKI